MPRKTIHRFLPDMGRLLQRPSLRWINIISHDPNLLHLNRHSVSLAVFIGIFCAFVPLPGQTIIAALDVLLAGCQPTYRHDGNLD